MVIKELDGIFVEQRAIASQFLKRQVIINLYIPKNFSADTSLLLINDGQDLSDMNFEQMLDRASISCSITSLFTVGIHAGRDRRNEYGTAATTDYAGRGAKAEAYNQFVLQELLPLIHIGFGMEKFKQIGFAGFSLGGLTAIDMTWHYPHIFSTVGVFSGSLWWRCKGLGPEYSDDRDRIMHEEIKKGKFHPGTRFYFTTGSLDEVADRNKNGIIDSIDDTLALIEELKKKGYTEEHDIKYINYEEGRHDVSTWGKAMPGFLLWGWGKEVQGEKLRVHSS